MANKLGWRLASGCWTQLCLQASIFLSPGPASLAADFILRPAPLRPHRRDSSPFLEFPAEVPQLRLTSTPGVKHLSLSQSPGQGWGNVLLGQQDNPAPSATSLPITLALHTWTFCCSLNLPVCPSPRATSLGPLCPPCPHSLLPTHILQPTLRDFRDHLSTLHLPACSISLHRCITTWCSAIFSCGIHVNYLSPSLGTMRANTASLFSLQYICIKR